MKNNKKVKVFFTIQLELYEKLQKHIDNNLLDKSKLIEFLIKEYMDKQSKND